MKAQGAKDFKAKWGNRPNVDNWNKASVVAAKFDASATTNDDKKSDDNAATNQGKNNKLNTLKKSAKDLQDANDMSPMGLGNPDIVDNVKTKDKTAAAVEKEMTAESLYASIPLTEEKINASNSIIIDALFQNGETFSNKLDDYPSAIAAYEELLRRFPKNKHAEQALFNLSYCYKVTNRTDKQQALQEKLDLDFNNGDLSKVMRNKSANSQKDSATKQYSDIYNMFLEGKYTEAKTAKREADSIYKKKYWNPQLSFIESVYYIKQREDSISIDRLNLIVKGNAEKPLQEKAKIMIDILKHRKQIEEYLSNLDSNGHYDSALAKMNALMKDSIALAKFKQEKERQNVLKIDSSLIGKEFRYNPNEPHYAVLLLDKVDDVFIKETVTSFNKYNKEKLTNSVLGVTSLKLNDQYHLILIGPLSNAPNGLSYIDDVKPQTIKILPWLPTFKYTYSLIGISNLEILKANNNMDKYKAFLQKTFPNKF